MTKILFDRDLLRLNRKRFADVFNKHNFLYHEVANRIAEDLLCLKQEVEDVLEIVPRDGYLSGLIKSKNKFICEDDEVLHETKSFDAIVSNLNLHFINDIPQFLLKVRSLLKPQGIFIASFFGEENLHELAHVLFQAESEIYSGISPRMLPVIDVKTSAALLQKAGFINPISNLDKIEVEYSGPRKLLDDLKFMGQGNILLTRSRRFFTKKFLEKILTTYRKFYGTPGGGVKATFEIITIVGWLV